MVVVCTVNINCTYPKWLINNICVIRFDIGIPLRFYPKKKKSTLTRPFVKLQFASYLQKGLVCITERLPM